MYAYLYQRLICCMYACMHVYMKVYFEWMYTLFINVCMYVYVCMYGCTVKQQMRDNATSFFAECISASMPAS